MTQNHPSSCNFHLVGTLWQILGPLHGSLAVYCPGSKIPSASQTHLHSCQNGELHTATAQQQHHSHNAHMMLRLFMSNLSMLDCYTILACCCCLVWQAIRLLRTLVSSFGFNRECVWITMHKSKRLGLTDCGQRGYNYWKTSWQQSIILLVQD